MPLIGTYTVNCSINGDYEPVQYHPSTGYYWCVDRKTGQKIPGSDKRHSRPICGVGMYIQYGFKYWTPGLPDGVLSNCPCPSICSLVRPSLNISETAHWIFLIFCMMLMHHKGTKVIEPDF